MTDMKNKFIKLVSVFLSVISVVGVFSSLGILPVYAADPKKGEEEEKEIIDYYTQVYNTPEQKLEAMELKQSNDNYELYYENYSGEVALKNKKSGQILFTNPYDVATTTGSDDTKSQLLSQIIIKYTDNDQEKNYYSYIEAAKREQIYVKNIKNGIRVEYTVGKEETRSLVPRLMEKSRFEEQILSLITDETALKKISAFYTLKDPDDPKLTVRGIKELQATFPITNKMAVYVFDPYASQREVNLIESYVKTYCTQYSYSELDYDHQMTEYTASGTAPAMFKLALEYRLQDDGVEVRLPANGIRFNESQYSLTYIQFLPYIGCGSYLNKGYTFIPDGSGSIVRFEDFAGKNLTISGKIYGQDFAYHEISGAHQQAMRLPVYGVVENARGTVKYKTTEKSVDDTGKEVEVEVDNEASLDEDRGYLAIITEGDAMANITTSHGGALHKYATVYTQFYPRPKDSYNLAESISVGENATWTVVSKRKYTGSYRIKYIMLTDENKAKENNIKDYYSVTWEGMAKAYRDYLVNKGDLVQLDPAKTSGDIPLYLETFGVIDTKTTILSIPVMVKTPLTTFEDIQTMTDELAASGVKNVIYRLTGYYNGGMETTIPTRVKFERKVGGNKGFDKLVDYAKSKGISVYPDFDLAYVSGTRLIDGFSHRKDAVKTIDNRYTTKRRYDSVEQTYRRTWLVAISPSVYTKLYEKFNKSFGKFNHMGVSVSTLGSDLNSDFDKKDPYNREDTREYTVDLFDKIKADYGSIMIDCGNAYALKYADHILNMSLDSSLYYYSSQSVPFMGMVLHGYVQYAGTPTNEAGDIKYELLKIIQSGASPYFLLSYQNIQKLKEDWRLSRYYSVSYEIWFEDLIKYYNILNDALKDCQSSTIDSCEFLYAERIPTDDEIAADKAEAELLAQEEAEALAKKEEKAARAAALKERKAAEEAAALGEEAPAEEPAAAEPAADDAAAAADGTATDAAGEETEAAAEAEEAEAPKEYEKTKYTTALGTVAKVSYSNGVVFYLNFNSFNVAVEGQTIEALQFIRVG